MGPLIKDCDEQHRGGDLEEMKERGAHHLPVVQVHLVGDRRAAAFLRRVVLVAGEAGGRRALREPAVAQVAHDEAQHKRADHHAAGEEPDDQHGEEHAERRDGQVRDVVEDAEVLEVRVPGHLDDGALGLPGIHLAAWPRVGRVGSSTAGERTSGPPGERAARAGVLHELGEQTGAVGPIPGPGLHALGGEQVGEADHLSLDLLKQLRVEGEAALVVAAGVHPGAQHGRLDRLDEDEAERPGEVERVLVVHLGEQQGKHRDECRQLYHPDEVRDAPLHCPQAVGPGGVY